MKALKLAFGSKSKDFCQLIKANRKAINRETK